MEKILYEMHNLENKKLPIIFHYNTVMADSFQNPIANWHNNIEILYCCGGTGQIICNSIAYDVQKGDLMVVNTNVLHAFHSKERFEYHCLIVDSDFLATNDITAEKIEFETIVTSETAQRLFEDVVEAVSATDQYRIAAARAKILELVVYLARNHSAEMSVDEKRRGIIDENVKPVIAYIKSNFAKRLTLEDIAEEVGLSKYYLAHTFKKAAGITIIAYMNAVRCQYAYSLLQMQKYSINEVASMCGFENNSYFTKTFKKVMGFLPSEVLKKQTGI